jgi:hypothetical protein
MSQVDKQYAMSNKIESLRREAEDLRDKWLELNGWKHTSQTPGCFWMWRKDDWFCDAGTAERIERILCSEAYFDLHPYQSGD